MFEQVEVNSERWFDLTNLKNEIWKDIKGYESLYQISNYGRLKSLIKKEKIIIIKLIHDKKNYLNYTLHKNGRTKSEKIHRLVAEAFIPNSENKPQINHINGIKTDNRVCNLEWCTNSENQIHAYKNGLEKPRFKRKVKQYDLNGNYINSYEYILDAKKVLNIDNSSISAVCRGKRKTAGGYIWKYADDNN